MVLYSIFLAGVVGVLGLLDVARKDPCLDAQVPTSCFMKKTYRIGIEQGASQAIEYAAEVVAPYNRNALHMSMHMAGHAAYDTLENRSEAIALLPEEAYEPGVELTYDGYLHGVLQAYYLADAEKTPVEELMRESCSEWFDVPEGKVAGVWERAGITCFHGIGHALMALYENDIKKSVSTCATLPRMWHQEWCAYGVFMEVAYQYHHGYGHSVTREGEDMSPVCERTPIFQRVCAKFVGHSYLMKKQGDIEGAFRACGKLSDGAHTCSVYLAEILLPGFSQNPHTLKAQCAFSGTFSDECFYWAATGLAEGFGGKKAVQKNICLYVHDKKKEVCNAFVKTHKNSLRMDDASE